MYSGTTLTPISGRLFGAHQKIDRLADKQLKRQLKANQAFPSIHNILHFEGNNGPDGIKRKSPAKDEPWHYFQPFNLNDHDLLDIIDSHFNRLVESLKQKDSVRSAFEAAWLAHALVDGLTPAHHFPYGEKVVELRGGQSLESRSSVKDKAIIPGATIWKLLTNNWKFWGPKGLLITHAFFEFGVASIIKPLQVKADLCGGANLFLVNNQNLTDWYRLRAQRVAKMDLYSSFYRSGWRRSLAKQIRKELLPLIVQTVALTWYGAVQEANNSI